MGWLAPFHRASPCDTSDAHQRGGHRAREKAAIGGGVPNPTRSGALKDCYQASPHQTRLNKAAIVPSDWGIPGVRGIRGHGLFQGTSP